MVPFPLSVTNLFLGLQYFWQSKLPVFVLVYRNADSLGANRVALSNLDDKFRLNIWHSNCINFRCPDTLKDNRSDAIYWWNWYCQLHSKLQITKIVNAKFFLPSPKSKATCPGRCADTEHFLQRPWVPIWRHPEMLLLLLVMFGRYQIIRRHQSSCSYLLLSPRIFLLKTVNL